MLKREHELLDIVWTELDGISNLHILANHIKERLSIISFYIDNLHFNLAVKLLNDRFGIQTRGGCSCAGTYGHYLLHVDKDYSHSITSEISCGILGHKPGWIRMSLHPTTTNEELIYSLDAIKQLCLLHEDWAKDYTYNSASNEYIHVKEDKNLLYNTVINWFDI